MEIQFAWLTENSAPVSTSSMNFCPLSQTDIMYSTVEFLPSLCSLKSPSPCQGCRVTVHQPEGGESLFLSKYAGLFLLRGFKTLQMHTMCLVFPHFRQLVSLNFVVYWGVIPTSTAVAVPASRILGVAAYHLDNWVHHFKQYRVLITRFCSCT